MNKPSHQRGSGLLYSSRSPSHTWPVLPTAAAPSPVFFDDARVRAVHHISHRHAMMLISVKTITNRLALSVMMAGSLHTRCAAMHRLRAANLLPQQIPHDVPCARSSTTGAER